jgi:quercetin 2,3-dioxygenase
MDQHATATATTKEIVGIYQPESTHMVGDGFPVRNLFPNNDLHQKVSPFLMLDYAGPQYFSPTDHRRGAGEHPHRKFETVTIVYEETCHTGTLPEAPESSARAMCSG